MAFRFLGRFLFVVEAIRPKNLLANNYKPVEKIKRKTKKIVSKLTYKVVEKLLVMSIIYGLLKLLGVNLKVAI